VLQYGEVIDEYKEDTPFPSYLVLGFAEGRALHVIVAVEWDNQKCHIITAYDPDPSLWETDFRKRRA
jgi:hypothetical protein